MIFTHRHTALLIVTMLLVGCEGPTGPQGETGPQGDSGVPGMQTSTFVIKASDWSGSDGVDRAFYPVPAINASVMESGAVVAFIGDISLPMVVPLGASTVTAMFMIEEGGINVSILSSNELMQFGSLGLFNERVLRVITIDPNPCCRQRTRMKEGVIN